MGVRTSCSPCQTSMPMHVGCCVYPVRAVSSTVNALQLVSSVGSVWVRV